MGTIHQFKGGCQTPACHDEFHFEAYGYSVAIYWLPAGVGNNDHAGWCAEVERNEGHQYCDRVVLCEDKAATCLAALEWCRTNDARERCEPCGEPIVHNACDNPDCDLGPF